MSYADALKALSRLGPELRISPGKPPRKFSLDLIRKLLNALENPHQGLAAVLIAGTNGKGSTSATLASIAASAGLRVGLYTSPHLRRINERIRATDGSPENSLHAIADEDFGRIFALVESRASHLVAGGELPHGPSFFELLTAMAFVYFAESGIKLAVLEVGLGGRLDATNVVEPVVSVITDIAMDHMEYLGNTLGEIAAEKAGILRENGVLVTLSQHPEANAAMGERAVALNVRGVDAARFLPPRTFAGVPSAGTGQTSPLARNSYDLPLEGAVLHVDSPLAGQHQQRNLALAIATAVELRANHGWTALTGEAIESGIRNTRWPGRLEWLPGRLGPGHQPHAPLLLDVAHNPAGVWALRWALAQLPEHLPRTLLFSCLADKQVHEIARILLPLFDSTSGDPLRLHDHVVLAPMANARGATADQLLAVAAALAVPAHAAPHVPAALTQAEALTPPHGLIVVTGSIFLVGEVRALVCAEPATDTGSEPFTASNR